MGYRGRVLRTFVVTVLLIAFLVWVARSVLLPFVLGATLAYIIAPVVERLHRCGLGRALAIFVTYLGVAVIVLGLVLVVLPDFLNEVQRLGALLPQYGQSVEQVVASVQRRYRGLPLPEGFRTTVDHAIGQLQSSAERGVRNTLLGFRGVVRWTLAFLLAPILAYYLLLDLPHIRSNVVTLIPVEVRQPVLALLADLDDILSGFVRGELLSSAAVALLSTVAATMLHLRYALMLGVLAGVAEFLPYIGPLLGAIPALLVATSGGAERVVLTALAYAVIQQIEGSLLTPSIMGESVGLHPLVVIAALLIGEHWGGLGGAVLAVPVAGALRVTTQHILRFLTRDRPSRTIA